MEYELEMMKNIKKIYNKLMDEESKNIFTYRFMFSLTGDYSYIRKMVDYITPNFTGGKELLAAIKSKKKKYAFGAGMKGNRFLMQWPHTVGKIFDNDNRLWGGDLHGVPVVSPSELLADKSDYVIFITVESSAEIRTQLLEMGVAPNQIIDVALIWNEISKRQYFDLPYLIHEENEVFVDAGAYDGRTSIQFLNWSDNKYKKIYCFEPIQHNVKKIKQAIKKYSVRNCYIVDRGVGDKIGKKCVKMLGEMATSININSQEVYIPVTTIDHELYGNDRVTFITFDVEGSEMEALKGACKVIETYKPKLAISIYHKPEDIFQIPELILSLRDDYNFYMRQYHLSHCDTVLFAI